MPAVEAMGAPRALQEGRGDNAAARADALAQASRPACASPGVLALRDAARAWAATAQPVDATPRATGEAALGAAFDAVMADVYATFALRYLRTLRQFLAPHATHRHTITVYADPQGCGLRVDGRNVEALPARGVYRLLQAISASLTYNWCVCLDGERLNGRP